MAKYLIPYVIEGELEIEAEDADDAQAKFFNYSAAELAELGTIEQLDQPMTLEELKERSDRYNTMVAEGAPVHGDGS